MGCPRLLAGAVVRLVVQRSNASGGGRWSALGLGDRIQDFHRVCVSGEGGRGERRRQVVRQPSRLPPVGWLAAGQEGREEPVGWLAAGQERREEGRMKGNNE